MRLTIEHANEIAASVTASPAFAVRLYADGEVGLSRGGTWVLADLRSEQALRDQMKRFEEQEREVPL